MKYIKIEYLLPALITVVYMVTIISSFVCWYGSNDNIAILRNIQSGCMVSFMSALMGRILSFCYLNISDVVPWYGLTLYALLGIGLYLNLLSIWKLIPHKLLSAAFLVMFLALSLRHIVSIDYSAVSIILASGSIIALLIYLEKTREIHILPVIFLGVCFSFSYLIRTHGIMAALCFAFPVVLTGVFKERKNYHRFLIFIIPLILTISTNSVYRNLSESESDRYFRKWNALRGQFHEFPVQRLNLENEDIRNVNNWSQNDYFMLCDFIYLDENKFNIDTLKNVFRYSVSYFNTSGEFISPPAKSELIQFFKSYPFYIAALFFVALYGFMIRYKRERLIIIVYLAFILGGAMWMQLFFRFPARIGSPILLNCIASMVYMIWNNENIQAEAKNTKKHQVIFAMIFLFFACVVFYNSYTNNLNRILVQKNSYNSMKELEEIQSDFFLILPRWEFFHFLSPLKNHKYSFKTIPCGWPIYSPLFYKALRENGMNHAYELLPKMAQNKNSYIVANNESINLISQYLKETFHIHIKVVQVKQLSNHLIVFRIEAI